MNKEEIITSIVNYLMSENPSYQGKIDIEDDLLDTWFIDSLSVLNIVFFLEDEFSVTIDRADINADTFATLNTISHYVIKQKS